MAKLTDFLGRPHSGVVPYAVVALVTDNVDPDELGRIQVKFPTLHQEPLSFWLRQASPNAGKERGLYALPEVDDEVLVIFMQGSQDVGVIIGQFWNGVDIPPKECKDGPGGETNAQSWSTDGWKAGSGSLDKNDRRFWKSRSGHIFSFDDSSGEETVQLWDNSRKLGMVFDVADGRIVITNATGDLHIRTAKDLYLEAGDNIKYKAGKDIKGEAGQNIKLKAGQNYDMEAGMNATCKAGTNFKIEGGVLFEGKGGAKATLTSPALAEVKAGLVKIN